MTKQEKRQEVIDNLKWAVNEKDVYDALYANDIEGVIDTMKDAITLLEAQEPVKPKRHGCMWYCGNCDTKLAMPHYDAASYCWKCGKAVDWSGRTAQD